MVIFLASWTDISAPNARARQADGVLDELAKGG